MIVKAIFVLIVSTFIISCAPKTPIQVAKENLEAIQNISGCGLHIKASKNLLDQQKTVQEFQQEIKTNKNECEVLIVKPTNNSDGIRLARSNSERSFDSVLLNRPSSELSDELEKKVPNEKKLLEIIVSILDAPSTTGMKSLYKTYDDERKYLNNSWPPKYGLSLSGGGTRSASFSIGVLKALNKTQKLKKIDVISSVSGGAYATYWYYSQQFYKDIICSRSSKYCFNDEDIFRRWSESSTNLENPDEYRFQHLLEESSNILLHAHKPSLWNDTKNVLQLASMSVIQGLSTPIHWLINGFFDSEINITPFFYFYKDGLDRTYGFVPLDYSMENFVNSEKAFFFLSRIWMLSPSLSMK